MKLERLRFPLSRHGGRRYPEPAHPYRNDFQRDRDRIIHARAFRRLEDKTQVFGAGLSDHFRNRLTHTIEVAQVARTVACALGLNEDLTEALALAHDIGHPPFAHAGEEELDRQMRAFGESFDHNLHALRIVEHFEQRYARFPGLNLTFAVREGIVKHSSDAAPEEYLPGLRPPLEAQLIDLADEVAYNAADLDDGYSAGLFDMEQIGAAAPAYGAMRKVVERSFPDAPVRVRFQELLRALINMLVSALIEGTTAAVKEAGVDSMDAVCRHPERLARMTASGTDTTRALKRFLSEKVYLSKALQEGRERACASIAWVFRFYLDHPAELPEGHREKVGAEPLHRVVCDYIAGMTDGFLLRTEARLRAIA